MSRPRRRAVTLGLGAALGMLAVYLGILTVIESWDHALSLLREDAIFVIPLATGFGAQVGLYTFMRRAAKLAGNQAGAMTGATGGTSTATMIACCAHHATDLLPLVGISAAATFLARYKLWLMGGALVVNLAGIAMLGAQLYRHRHHLLGHRGEPVVLSRASMEGQGQ